MSSLASEEFYKLSFQLNSCQLDVKENITQLQDRYGLVLLIQEYTAIHIYRSKERESSSFQRTKMKVYTLIELYGDKASHNSCDFLTLLIFLFFSQDDDDDDVHRREVHENDCLHSFKECVFLMKSLSPDLVLEEKPERK